jgi:hypothetical protein
MTAMFNEPDMAVLQEARDDMISRRPTAFWFELTVEDLATALDKAGVCGLVHDGTRVIAQSIKRPWSEKEGGDIPPSYG